jgi:hypothetical protein
MQTISAILVVRCSDTIPAQNWLNTRVDKVGMVRVTRSGGCNRSGKGLRDGISVRNKLRKMSLEIIGARIEAMLHSGLPLLSKFIICSTRIAEVDPAQPRIPN